MSVDPRVKCSPDQLIAARELIQAFLYAIDTQPNKRDFNYAILLRVAALLQGKAPVAEIRDDQIAEALDAAELLQARAGSRPIH